MSIQLSAARGRRTMDSYINSKAETRRSRASGMVTGVSTDAANMLTRATVNLSGASISVPVPFGMSVYEGMNVQLSNHGSSSQANWQITGTAVPTGITGGTITNPSGAITQIFDNIWVRNDGFVMIGGDIDLEGNPVGPRIVGTSCGLKGYNEYEEVSLALYSSHCDDRNPGDSIFGLLGGPHVEILPEVGEVGIYNGTEAVLLFSQNGNFIRHPLTIGDPIGSRFNIGEIDDKATFVIRNKFGVAKLVARTDDNGGVYFHVGNPPPQGKSFYFDEDANELVVSGKIIMEEGEVAGRLDFRSTGSFMIADPDDPSRYGMITPRGIYAYSVDGQGQQYLNSVDAWGPLTLESRGVTKTWLAGEMMRGDANYRHFRSERGAGGRTGLFNGDTPVVYIDYAGNGFFSGTIAASAGTIGNWIISNSDGQIQSTDGYVRLSTETGLTFSTMLVETALDVDSQDVRNNMITFWENGTSDAWPTHQILAYVNRDETPDNHILHIEAQPLYGNRAKLRLRALSDKQASVEISAVGGYDTASQEIAKIELLAYRGEGTVFDYPRIDFTGVPYLVPYTDAAGPGISVPDGLFLHTDGTYDPGAGEGLYFRINGGWRPIRLAAGAWEAKTANFTAANVDFYPVTTGASAIVATLPDALTKPDDWQYTFKKIDAGAGTVVITPASTKTIDGAATYTLTAQWSFVTIRRYGSSWLIVAKG